MSITTELKTAINTAIQADASIVAATNWRGYGVADDTQELDYLSWYLVGDDNDDFMRANADYYKGVDIQFSAWAVSPDDAADIRDDVEALFRFNILTLSSGRHLSTEIGSGLELEDPESDGWQSTVTLTFNIGT
jgi:hypothetical protein